MISGRQPSISQSRQSNTRAWTTGARAAADVCVLGGGVIGLCSAYFLAKEGFKVTLFDRSASADGKLHGTAPGSAGLIVPSHVVPMAAPKVMAQGIRWLLNPESPFYIRPRLSWDLAKWLWKFRNNCTDQHVKDSGPILRLLQMESVSLFDQFAKNDGFSFEFEKRGLLNVFIKSFSLEAECSALESRRNLYPSFKVLDREQVREVEPNLSQRVIGGILHTEDAHVQPAKFLSGLADQLQRMGVVILSNTIVHGMETEAGVVPAVATNRGRYLADQWVVAGGSWSSVLVRNLGICLPVEAGKGYSITVPRTHDLPSIPTYLAEAKVATTPFQDSFRFAGTLELAGLDERINQRRVTGILRSAREYLSADGDWDCIAPSVGLRSCSPDGLPIIGRLPNFDNLIVATGHGTVGLSLGPITGKLVSQIASRDDPAVDMGMLRADRFFSICNRS